MSEVAFHAMTPADLEAVADLTHRADPFGWTLRNFSDAHASGNTLTVLTVDGVTSGIAAVMHVLDESELLEIAVQPAMQGRGYGKALLAQAIALARRNGAVRMFLEVRESNARARKMYTSFGFEETGRRKNYYPTENGREDAILMTAQLSRSVPTIKKIEKVTHQWR